MEPSSQFALWNVSSTSNRPTLVTSRSFSTLQSLIKMQQDEDLMKIKLIRYDGYDQVNLSVHSKHLKVGYCSSVPFLPNMIGPAYLECYLEWNEPDSHCNGPYDFKYFRMFLILSALNQSHSPLHPYPRDPISL